MTKVAMECITPDTVEELEAMDREQERAAANVAAGEAAGREVHELGGVPTIDLYRELLLRMGEDPSRDGLVRTPERMEKSMAYLTRGYGQSVEEVLHGALFEVDYDEMVMVRDVEFYSQCEHHLLPFFREGARGVCAEWKGDRVEQDSAGGGCVLRGGYKFRSD